MSDIGNPYKLGNVPGFCPICMEPIRDHAKDCPSRFGRAEEDEMKSPTRIVSDGGSSNYYKLPDDAADLQDLIEDKEMSFARGNLFKALYRMGEKDGIDVGYDLRKMQWFLDRMKRMHKRGKRL